MLHIHKQRHGEHLPEFIETAIIIAILLVVGHTITEEISIIYHWNHEWSVRLAYAAFGFDLLFSLEFTARAIITARHGHFRLYMLKQRGWIDLMSSFPLLLFVSGPVAAVMFFSLDMEGSGAMQMLVILKTAKAIRVTRILRLIRVIKIFGRIQNTNSAMTNRQIATISTISVVSLVVVLTISQFVPFLSVGDHNEYLAQRTRELSPLFDAGGIAEKSAVDYIGKSADDVIDIHDPNNILVYQSPEINQLKWTAYHAGRIPLKNGYTMSLSYYRVDAEHARLSLLILIIILSLILSFMFIYTGIFAHQISDPIYIMDKGFREWDYNLEVKVNQDYLHEEIFQLAQIYNARWLPLKNQVHNYRKSKGDVKSVLSVKDLL